MQLAEFKQKKAAAAAAKKAAKDGSSQPNSTSVSVSPDKGVSSPAKSGFALGASCGDQPKSSAAQKPLEQSRSSVSI